MSAPAQPLSQTPSSGRFRDPVNGLLHFSGLIASIFATLALVAQAHGDPLRLAAFAIYGLGMVGCFSGSSLHHLVRGTLEQEQWYLKIDHAAIYPFIAGTFTPICLLGLIPAPAGHWLLGLVWLLALVGMVYKLRFAAVQADVNDPPTPADTALYVLMGALALLQVGPLWQHTHAGTAWLLAAGGLGYAIGGLILTHRLFDFKPGRFGHHEIWHLMVLEGTACFYAFIWLNLA